MDPPLPSASSSSSSAPHSAPPFTNQFIASSSPPHPTIGQLLYSGADIHRGAFHPQQHNHSNVRTEAQLNQQQTQTQQHSQQRPPHLHHSAQCCDDIEPSKKVDSSQELSPIRHNHSHPNPHHSHDHNTSHHHHNHDHNNHDHSHSGHGDGCNPSSIYIETEEDDDQLNEADFDNTAAGGEAEAKHFHSVCEAFSNYAIDSMGEICRMESHFHSLSDDDKSLLMEDVNSRIAKIKSAVRNNQNFLNLILIDQGQLQDDDDDDDDYDDYDKVGGNGRSYPSTDGSEVNVTQSVTDRRANEASSMRGTEAGETAGSRKSNKQENNNNRGHDSNKVLLDSSKADDGHQSAAVDTAAAAAAHSSASASASGFAMGPETNQEPQESAEIPLFCQTRARKKVAARRSHTASRNISKVRSTLRQFVRDWSDEGRSERDAAYQPLLDALDLMLPLQPFKLAHGRPPRILCPGSGLGRLPFEVVRRGYACQGNEFSYFMLLGSNLLLNCNVPPKSCVIQPYCLSTSNRINHQDHLLEVRIPDVCPVDVVGMGHDFSMCAGEFVEVYWKQEKQWDGILTCFFIDTAKNVLQYIRTIARILRPGGLWANLGPLLYHFSDMPNEISIELSWEEIRRVIELYFTIKSVEWRDAYYTTNRSSMMQVLYHCIYFIAIRNEVEVNGLSNAVY